MNNKFLSHTAIWDSTGIHFDCETGLPITGKWRPMTTQDLKSTASQFSFNIFTFGSGQTLIPTGIKAYSIGVLSGTVYVNGVLLPIGTSVNGGNYTTNATLNTFIQISGDAKAAGIVMWEA